jgi:hypothetical protein
VAGVCAVVAEVAIGQRLQAGGPRAAAADRDRDAVQGRRPPAAQRPEDDVVDEVRPTLAGRGGQPPVRLGDLLVQQGQIPVHL